MACALHLLFFLCGISGPLTGVWSYPTAFKKGPFCPKDWTQLDCFCYVYQDEPRTFADAEAVCNILGGNLVSIHNELENAVVQQLILAGDNNNNLGWTGLHDAIQKNDSIWTDGTVENYQNFAKTVGSTGDCVVMEETAGQWRNMACTDLQEYVCIKDAHRFH